MTRIRKSGGYRKLAAFQTATLIYDAVYWFCEKFLDEKRTRTVDQMVQAARSGRQNIAEGSRAAATSSQTELRLINVARSSLEELLLDCEDYLRHRRLAQWPADSPEAMAVRSVPWQFKKDRSDQTDRTDLSDLSDQQRWSLYARWLEHEDPAVRINAIICLIHQANFLLDQQIDALEEQFINEGGYSEQLATARLQKRAEQRTGPHSGMVEDGAPSGGSQAPPHCPQCGSMMALRTAKSGKTPGSQFWGCTAYPQCRGTIPV